MKSTIFILCFYALCSNVLSQFYDIGAAIGNIKGKADWGDYDNDGDLDLAIIGSSSSGTLYGKILKNNGSGSFSHVEDIMALADGSVQWGDYDNDGDLDLVISGNNSLGNSRTRIFKNTGNDIFQDINAGLPGTVVGRSTWGDYDNDGDLDLLITGYSSYDPFTEIYRNDGGDDFTDINAGLVQVYFSSCDWGDYDNDGDLDIVLAGRDDDDFSITKIYRNDGQGIFTDVNAELTGAAIGTVEWGDYDNDGDLDLLVIGESNTSRVSQIYRNDQNNSFINIAAGLDGAYYSSGAWGDYDSDGWLDLIIIGRTASLTSSKLYHNNQNETFSEIPTGFVPLRAGDIAWGDYNNDGRLDVLLTGSDWSSSNCYSIIYRNYYDANSIPLPPSELTTANIGSNIVFSWNPSSDVQTPTLGLGYSLRLGTTPTGYDIVSPMSSNTGYRQIARDGHSHYNLNWKISASKLATYNQYYWSVQAIDKSFSGSPFAQEVVYQPIKVTSPNGGEHYTQGTQQTITWVSNPTISQVNVYMSLDDGVTWNLMNSGPITASLGEYIAILPNTPSTQCLLMVKNAANGSIFDTSDSVFEIGIFPPLAAFSADVTEGLQPLTVQFTDSSTPGSGEIMGWLWNFGDGNTSTEQSPLYTYQNDGIYTVTLSVTNTYNTTSVLQRQNYINVLPRYPIICMPLVSLSFGNVYLGSTSEPIELWLTNTGNATLTVDNITQYLYDSPFSISYSLLPIEILDGDSTLISVSFTPQNTDSVIDTLYIHNNSTNMPLAMIHLSGRGVYVPPAPPGNVSIVMNCYDAVISWDAVTQTIFGTPIEPDYYLIFYNGSSDPENGLYYYLWDTPGLQFTHHLVGLHAQHMFYHVIAYKYYGRGEDPILYLRSGTPENDVIMMLKGEEK
jgi:PKD repeat protein